MRTRRTAGLLALTLAAACSEVATSPLPLPDIADAYAVNVYFDATDPALHAGTLRIEAPDARGAFTGSATITMDGQTFASDAVTGTITPDSAVRFVVRDPTGSWTFTGAVDDGSMLSGRHVLAVAGSPDLSGDWIAVRQ